MDLAVKKLLHKILRDLDWLNKGSLLPQEDVADWALMEHLVESIKQTALEIVQHIH